MKVKVAGIGIGMPGEIDKETGKLFCSPNLTLIEGIEIGKRIEAMIGLPVIIDNDANTFLRGEVEAGAARNFKSVYSLTLGTGVGGAWWFNGGIYRGAYGGGKEPGHMVIDRSAGLDFEKSYQRLTQNNPAKLSQEAVIGDVLAEKAYEEFGLDLGAAMANIVNLIDPEAFVLGGSGEIIRLVSSPKIMKDYIFSVIGKLNHKVSSAKTLVRSAALP
jgi:glucokinase